MDNIGALIVPAAIALFAISIVARGIRIVQQAQTMIIERLDDADPPRSEEHTSELQSPCNLVCRLLLEKKKHNTHTPTSAHPSHVTLVNPTPRANTTAGTDNPLWSSAFHSSVRTHDTVSFAYPACFVPN